MELICLLVEEAHVTVALPVCSHWQCAGEPADYIWMSYVNFPFLFPPAWYQNAGMAPRKL